mmetsp:Transcript_28066/g.36266  ORF Transcript_28066/g.36266 Transcript_28066/m.36266 type:complete len:86 (+) Transcript_28066:193-450(+)
MDKNKEEIFYCEEISDKNGNAQSFGPGDEYIAAYWWSRIDMRRNGYLLMDDKYAAKKRNLDITKTWKITITVYSSVIDWNSHDSL